MQVKKPHCSLGSHNALKIKFLLGKKLNSVSKKDSLFYSSRKAALLIIFLFQELPTPNLVDFSVLMEIILFFFPFSFFSLFLLCWFFFDLFHLFGCFVCLLRGKAVSFFCGGLFGVLCGLVCLLCFGFGLFYFCLIQK